MNYRVNKRISRYMLLIVWAQLARANSARAVAENKKD